jgi:conjugative relaxase-like TrwC/TraI family protein
MLSIAPVTSGVGAAAYYAGDNYYCDAQLKEHSEWTGRGAEALGLVGPVDQKLFEAVLEGRLPDGSVIPDGTRGVHRPGVDLTFSAPKSVSLMAYLGGDARLLEAHRATVRSTLAWAERHYAEVRVTDSSGRQRLVTSGNLVVALFQHDTSRLLDPQAHIHAVIANATAAPDGQWRALAGHALWTGKTTIASVYNATFRQAVERLGYTTEASGRHGQFEIAGVSREAIAAFSQRRAEIVETAKGLAHQTPAAMAAVTLRTRGAKPEAVDRDQLHAEWQERASAIGFDPRPMVKAALRVAARGIEGWQRLIAGIRGITAQARALVERLGLIDPAHPHDPLVPERPGRMSPADYAAAHAVAAGARHLGEREAGWARLDLVKAALDLGPPVGVQGIEHRIAHLVAKGLLVAAPDGKMMTTAQAIARERAFLDAVAVGRGCSAPLLAREGTRERERDAGEGRGGGTARERPRDERSARQPATTKERDRAAAPTPDVGWSRGGARDGPRDEATPPATAEASSRRALASEAARGGLRLTRGQMQAGVSILASSDRTVAIQGDAGSGKSSMLRPVARLLEAEGRPVLGLAVSHAIAARLGEDVGVPTMTVARFLNTHRGLRDPGKAGAAEASDIRGAVLLVDEASMLSTRDAERLVAIANATGVARLALIGDAKQLGAVEAGRPFADMQTSDTASMRENLRARTDVVRLVHKLAQGHDMQGLAKALEGHTVTTEATAREAAERWMALPPEDRATTAIFVTGRALRAAVNQAVQAQRAERGETLPGLTIKGVLSEVHLTREEQRHPQYYRPGQVVLLSRPLTAQGLPAGRMAILSREPRGAFRVKREDGREGRFTPGRLAANRVSDAVRLFEARDLPLNIGDPIVWRANDPERGIRNSERAVLAEVDPAHARFLKPDGTLLSLRRDDPMLTRLDLGYALNAHAAQGATADKAILVARADEGRLITPPLMAVLLTRARDDIHLITNSLDQLLGRAQRQPGEKVSAKAIAAPIREPRQIEMTLPPPEPDNPKPRVPEKYRDMEIGW